MPKVVDVDMDELTPAGDGLASAGRLRIAVPFTIPGERVRVRLDTAQCIHFDPDAVQGLGPCGCCAWQHIAYPEQGDGALRARIASRDSR